MTDASAKKLLKKSLWIPATFVAFLWLVAVVEWLSGTSLHRWGIEPRTTNGVIGILLAPLIHSDWQHLISNTLPLLVLGFAVINGYPKIYLRAFGWIYLLTGLWVWVAARPSYHIGASGLIYGLASFLFFMGLFRKDTRSMALALMVAFLYGGLVWGVLPIQPGVSWESHLLGAVAGIFAAVMYYKVDLPPRKVLPDYHPTDIPHLPYWKYEVEGGIKSEYQHSTGPKVKIQYHYKGQSSDAPDTIAPPKESPGSDDNP